MHKKIKKKSQVVRPAARNNQRMQGKMSFVLCACKARLQPQDFAIGDVPFADLIY